MNSNTIFVPKNKQEEYFKKNNITYHVLSNGITIVGIPRLTKDTYKASVSFVFNSGSHNDPIGKEGAHHLFEHLAMNKINNFSESVDVYKNALTSYKNLSFVIDGPANPNVLNYGIWPMLDRTINMLKDPMSDVKSTDLEKEIKVILQELSENLASTSYHAMKFLFKCILSSNNPMLTDTIGNEKSLKRISLTDLKKIEEKVFCPKNLIVFIKSEGDLSICEKILEYIKPKLINFPRKDITPFKFDHNLISSTNQNITQDMVFINQDNLNNKLLNLYYTWIFPCESFTPESFALNRLLPDLSDGLFNYLRRVGLSYSSKADSITLLNKRMVYFSLVLPNSITKDLIRNNLLNDVKQEVLKKITDQQLKNLAEKERLIQKATPMSCENRFDILVDGIENFNKIIDADEVKNDYDKITFELLKNWRNKLLNNDPYIIMSGDITN